MNETAGRENGERVLKICQIGENEVITLAAGEVSHYLARMSPGGAIIEVVKAKKYDPAVKNTLWVGLTKDFGVASLTVPLPELDDAFLVRVQRGEGIIAGVNERSVLLGAYRFLTEAGCRWVRPGPAGEFIPEQEAWEINVELQEKASYRHRGLCIEGAVSLENVKEIVDWAPKVGFNAYFIQFREAYIFFERWYTHRNNPLQKPDFFPKEKARAFVREIEKEIKKRGLLYHAVGHGWTCEPLGIPALGWDPGKYRVSQAQRRFLAEVDGRRDFFHGVPLNTNLCYSNPEARRLIVEEVVRYLKVHDGIDFLHLWLADEINNQCECEECRKALPADYYLQILNELDEALTKEGLKTRIVFLLYMDLLWPPEKEKIKNPQRFVLMFAPITRTYRRHLSPVKEAKLPPYRRNRLQLPSSIEENLRFLRAWQQVFPGDSFDFDYHLMWAHYEDPGYCNIAQLLSRDIKSLHEIDLNGLVSCQVQRAFFPTGLPMYIMGRTLWDAGLDYEELTADYFNTAFGDAGAVCLEYLRRLSALFDRPGLWEGKSGDVEREALRSSLAEILQDLEAVIEKNSRQKDRCRAASWNYLSFFSRFCSLLGAFLTAGKGEERNTAWGKLKEFLWENENHLQAVFDVFEFIETIERKGAAK